MEYFYACISLFSGLGAFLLGFKIISGSMEKKAARKLEILFKKTAGNRFSGVGLGAAVTAVVQSSSLTTSMTVSMVNAGVMTLYQAAAVIMGANIGSTLTAQLAALQAFNFVEIAMILVFIGTIFYIAGKNDKIKAAGYAVAGLGLVFVGLKFMSGTMAVFGESQAITHALAKFENPFVLLFIGILITALIQSSSAVTSILIAMAGAGLSIGSGGNSVLYVVLGTNIGTCITAIISAIGTGKNAKRAAFMHLMFNVFGTVIFLAILLPWSGFMDATFAKWFHGHPDTQIAMFHTFFNVACTILFLPFIEMFVCLSQIFIKDGTANRVFDK